MSKWQRNLGLYQELPQSSSPSPKSYCEKWRVFPIYNPQYRFWSSWAPGTPGSAPRSRTGFYGSSTNYVTTRRNQYETLTITYHLVILTESPSKSSRSGYVICGLTLNVPNAWHVPLSKFPWIPLNSLGSIHKLRNHPSNFQVLGILKWF